MCCLGHSADLMCILEIKKINTTRLDKNSPEYVRHQTHMGNGSQRLWPALFHASSVRPVHETWFPLISISGPDVSLSLLVDSRSMEK